MPRAHEFPVGTRFTRLQTTSTTYYKSTLKARVVDVICDCGTVLTVRVGHVVRGHVKSCGCLKREQSRNWCSRPENPLRRRGKDSVRYKAGGRQDKAEWLLHEKSNPCTDCGCTYHYSVMQFDHMPERGAKRFEINTSNVNKNGLTLADLIEERAKCDIVCANCHAWRTWLRRTGQQLRRMRSEEYYARR